VYIASSLTSPCWQKHAAGGIVRATAIRRPYRRSSSPTLIKVCFECMGMEGRADRECPEATFAPTYCISGAKVSIGA